MNAVFDQLLDIEMLHVFSLSLQSFSFFFFLSIENCRDFDHFYFKDYWILCNTICFPRLFLNLQSSSGIQETASCVIIFWQEKTFERRQYVKHNFLLTKGNIEIFCLSRINSNYAFIAEGLNTTWLNMLFDIRNCESSIIH